MKNLWLESKVSYDGSQLRSLYNYLEHGVLGDSVIAWQGSCNVTIDHMVDGEDLKSGASIAAESMVHFIIEKFNINLFAAFAIQRLLAEIIISHVRRKSPVKEVTQEIVRCGDDIYFKDKKFNISIATVSPSSSLIHFAVNIDGKGAPVPTLSLKELKLEPELFAKEVMDILTKEIMHMERATQKVKWVK